MERLTGIDASFLYFETPEHLMHVCGLLVLDTTTMRRPYRFEVMRRAIGLAVRDNPVFARKLHDPAFNIDHPVWVDDEGFDIGNHVFRATAAAPGGREELAAIAGDVAGKALDRSKPLWEIWLIDGLADGRVAVLAKIHHSLVDGVTAANLVDTLCGAGSTITLTGAPVAPVAAPDDAAIVRSGLRRFARRPAEFFRLLPNTLPVLPGWVSRARSGTGMPAPFTAPRTSFNATITGNRSVAFTRISLDDVMAVKNAYGVTVNDVVMSLCSGGLRRYLAERGELPDAPLVTSVPVSLHGQTGMTGANHVSSMFMSVRTDVADPIERLYATNERNKLSKEHFASLDKMLLMHWMELAPGSLAGAIRAYGKLGLADHHPVVQSLVLSNVPGPKGPLHMFGARVERFYPFGPVFHGAGLNITVVSNDGHIDVGVNACTEVAGDLWTIVDEIPAVLTELMSSFRDAEVVDEPAAEIAA
jgi:WS/DGAT/MGAT family acyltransferase